MTALIRAVVETAALRHNLAVVRRQAPHSRVLAVVKTNAYGHGSVVAAKALADADAFAVARLEEGIQLREAGLAHPVLYIHLLLLIPRKSQVQTRQDPFGLQSLQF